MYFRELIFTVTKAKSVTDCGQPPGKSIREEIHFESYNI